MPKLEGSFNALGLTLRKDNDTFKSTYEIFNDLAKIWNTLTDFQKANITELVAGKHQGNIVAAMLENWKDAVASYETALDSAGSAMDEFTKYQESMEYRVNQFKNAVIGFWQEAINTDGVKDYIDAGTTFMGVMTGVVKATGLLPPVIFAVSFALIGLNKELRTAIVNIGSAKTATDLFTGSMKGLKTSLSTVGKFFKGFIIPTLALTAASMLLAQLAEVVMDFKNATKLAKENLADLNAEITDGEKEIDSIKKLRDEYEDLSNITYKTEEQKQRFKNIQEQLTNQFPELIKGYNDEGEVIMANNKEIDDLISKKEKLLELNKETLAIEFDAKGDDLQDEVEKQKKDLDELHEKRERLIKQHDKIKTSKLDFVVDNNYNYINKEKELKRLSDQISNTTTEINDLSKEMSGNVSQNKRWAVAVLELDNNFKELGSSINNDLINAAQKLNNTKITDFVSQIKNTNIHKHIKEIENAVNNLNNAIISDADFAKIYKDNFDEIGRIVGATFDESDDYVQAFIDSLRTSYYDSEKVHRDVFDKKLETSKSFYQIIILGNNDMVKKFAEQYRVDLKNFSDLAQAKQNIEMEMLKNNIKGWQRYFDATTGAMTSVYKALQKDFNLDFSGMGSMDSAARTEFMMVNAVLYDIEKAKRELDDAINKGFESPNITGSSLDPLSKSDSKTKKEFEKTYDLTKERLDDLKHRAEVLRDKIEDATTIDEKTGFYNQLIQVYKETENFLRQKWQFENDRLWDVKQQLKAVLSPDDYEKVIQGHASDLRITNEETSKLIDSYYELNSAFRQTTMEIKGMDNQAREAYARIEEMYNKVADEIINLYKEVYEKQKQVELNGVDEKLKKEEKLHKQRIDDLQDELKKYEKKTKKKNELDDDRLKKLKQQHDEIMKMLDKELDAIEEAINARIKSMDREEDTEQYEKQLKKYQEEYLDIQEQINKLSLNNSEEANLQREDLEKQLNEKREQIDDLMKNRRKQLRKDNLQDEMEDYRKQYKNKKESEQEKYELEKNKIEQIKKDRDEDLTNYKDYINQQIEKEKEKFEKTKERLEQQKKDIERYYEDLINDERRFANMRRAILAGNINAMQNDLNSFRQFIENNMDQIGKSISRNLIDKIDEANDALHRVGVGASKTGLPFGMSSDDFNTYYQAKANAEKGIDVEYWHKQANKIRRKYPELERMDSGGGTYSAEAFKNLRTYHKGGVVGGSGLDEKANFINKIFNLKPDEEAAKLLKKEVVVKRNGFDNFITNVKNAMTGVNSNVENNDNKKVELNMYIDKMIGDKKGGQEVFTEIRKGLNKLGLV